MLNERLGNTWQSYGFNNLLTQVKQAFSLRKQKGLSVTAQLMVDILKSEENRQLRIERYNRKKKSKEQ